MLKKTLPFVLMSGLILGGCYNNGAMPADYDERAMPNMEDNRDERNWKPDVRDERRGGMDLDGFDHNENRDGNSKRDGTVTNERDDLRDSVNDDLDTIEDGTSDQRRQVD